MSEQQQQQQPKPGINPSLADLDKPKPPDTPTPAGGNPTEQKDPPPPPPNPTTTPSPADEAAKAEADKKAAEAAAATDNEGNQTGDEDGDANPKDFWNEVSKLRGDEFNWEFPEEIDPMTPAGIHHAIKLATDRELELFEENLMKTDRRAYAYMLHRDNGGSDEDFFKDKTEVLPDLDTLKNSVDLQQAFYKRSLTRRGILPNQADLIIKDAIEKKELLGLTEAEHRQESAKQEAQLKELLRLNDENRKREEQLIQRMGTILQQRIIENKDLGITIPDAKRGGFLQFVNNMVHLDRESGRFFIQEELSQENMSKVLEALYYMHVGGNMDDIITNRAKVQNTNKFKLRMQSDKTKKNTQTDPNKQTLEKQGVQRPISEL